MERKRYTIAILLLAMMIWPFATTIAQTPRAIAFEGIENARDMGGLVMQDGRTIRSGMLLRSGNLEGTIEKDFYGNNLSPFVLIEKGREASPEEVERNPRARSAKLRVAEKKS